MIGGLAARAAPPLHLHPRTPAGRVAARSLVTTPRVHWARLALPHARSAPPPHARRRSACRG